MKVQRSLQHILQQHKHITAENWPNKMSAAVA